MPELPEVETTRRGLWPHMEGRILQQVVARRRNLRWPIPRTITTLRDQPVVSLQRRAKYLLLELPKGWIITHLGMSGSMRVELSPDSTPRKHDHVDWRLDTGHLIRFHDPRRFGFMLWQRGADPQKHKLLAGLGPEPLSEAFSGEWLWQQSRGRRVPVKSFVMNNHVVVGVGNIYASEALFLAGIHPKRAAGRISLERYELLAQAVVKVLKRSIRQGGTTLRDFVGGEGEPGYFRQQLNVYDRHGLRCKRCPGTVTSQVIGQRNSYYCSQCQR